MIIKLNLTIKFLCETSLHTATVIQISINRVFKDHPKGILKRNRLQQLFGQYHLPQLEGAQMRVSTLGVGYRCYKLCMLLLNHQSRVKFEATNFDMIFFSSLF